MRGFQTAVAIAAAVAVCLNTGGCGSRGMVTFSIDAPGMKSLDPITTQVTEYSLKHLDGTVVAVASESASAGDTLPLGPLTASMMPIDLQLQVLSGGALLGMGRILDVSIENGVQKNYDISVRKPLLTIGSAIPTEPSSVKLALPGQIIDPTQGNVDVTMMNGPRLPQQTVATAATWDGRFLLAASAMSKGMDVIDTGSGHTVGTVPLGFVPARVAVGARDSAAAVLDPAGALILFADIGALTSNPAGATGMKVTLMGSQRTMTFAPDGLSVFVLGGTDADPCSMPAPSKNGITVVGLDGTIKGNWMLPGFVSDLAVDALSNKVVISDVSDARVSVFDAGAEFGTVNVMKVSTATCATAVRVANGEAFVVTADRPSMAPVDDNHFVMQRINLASGMTTLISFPGPYFTENVTGQAPPDNNTAFNFQLRPAAIYAYDLAVTPDGARAVFAIRTRYQESSSQPFQFAMESCTPNIDIVEYGLYTLDTEAGTAQYTSRSQLIQTPTDFNNTPCVTCKLLGQTDITLLCQPSVAAGDKAAGLAAIFGGT
jgi:hypothetical protein